MWKWAWLFLFFILQDVVMSLTYEEIEIPDDFPSLASLAELIDLDLEAKTKEELLNIIEEQKTQIFMLSLLGDMLKNIELETMDQAIDFIDRLQQTVRYIKTHQVAINNSKIDEQALADLQSVISREHRNVDRRLDRLQKIATKRQRYQSVAFSQVLSHVDKTTGKVTPETKNSDSKKLKHVKKCAKRT